MMRNLKPEMRKPQRSGIRGVALIIVLGLLVIILGLAVTFLNKTTIERGAAASYAANAATRQYADTAVNLVQGQIHRASTLGANVAWASQPGMIRTFGAGAGPYTASTNALLNFKLYSAPDMVTAATTFADDVPPATWADEKALWTDLNSPVRGIYPIIDSGALSIPVEEFSITSAPGVTATQPIPMPVRWLYLLQRGEIVAPSGSGNALTVAGAGTNNPIVGRIAFWTDDETCKVNINTASDGTFWDLPRADTAEERSLAHYQPAQKEFQRYPGHPAMTSLRGVLPFLTPEQIYGIVPRVVGGGSNLGTAIPTGALTPESDRLYASVDELIFSPGRQANGLTEAQLKAARFFLTASSRAPEVTLFNTPRVAIWPIDLNSTPAYRTAFDRLIARCATINASPYFFQRQNPKSATADASIPRNAEIYSYLQKLTDVPFPGFGPPSFAAKFGADRDQILTEIFDYIRSTNLDDSGLAAANRYGTRAEVTPNRGLGQVVPSRIGSTQGFGRFPVISEAGIHFICTADGAGFKILGNKPTLAQCGAAPDNQKIKEANDAKIDSNIAANTTLGGTLMKGEPFFDIGYGVSNTGKNNNKFDWDDSTGTPYGILWTGNGRCDFEPWNDANEDGQWSAGELYWDANGNGAYDVEAHEPLHDWGRSNDAQQAWVPSDWSALQPVTVWPSAGLSADTQSNGQYDPAQRRIEALFFLETFIPGQGWPSVFPAYSVRIRGLNQFQIAGGLPSPNLGLSADATDLSDLSSNYVVHGRNWGGSSSHRASLFQAKLPARGVMPADASPYSKALYPFVSIPMTVNTASGTMTFVGGTLTIDVYPRDSDTYPGYSTGTNPVSTYMIDIPGGTFPIPSLVASGTAASGVTPATNKENWWTFSNDGCGLAANGRINFINLTPTDGTQGAPLAGAPFRTDDVVRTVVPAHSDFRLLLAASGSIPAAAFVKHPNYDTNANLAHSVVEGVFSKLFAGATFATDNLAAGLNYSGDKSPDVAISNSAAASGDWDNGVSITVDGPYINKPDEGNSMGLSAGMIPYFDSEWGYVNSGQAMFSPNRQVPSAGMFGSLPSGAKAGSPYRTLLFRPQIGHFGDTNPKDHLWSDLFWMPIVEPYAISEPFSTAGKINMNYQIQPFDYIRRATGMAAILRTERIMAIPNGNALNYKTGAGSAIFRKSIDIPQTLSQFDAVFNSGTLFKSASQIMEIPLVPAGQTVTGMTTFWDNYKLTGDNSRERPYTNLLGRLTTKSNTYTVHYRVQSLKKSSATPAGQWDESRDKVTGEYRGSTTVERYINPNDPAIPPYGSSADPLAEPGLGLFYKWRVVNTRKFAP